MASSITTEFGQKVDNLQLVSDQNIDDKKYDMGSKLQQREDERQADVMKRKEEKDKAIVAEETANHFLESFSNEKSLLEMGLEKATSIDKHQLAAHFDDLSARLHKLQKFFAESTMFLPSYDVRQAQASLNSIQSRLQDNRDELLPKKKFSFKSKKKTVDQPIEKEISSTVHDRVTVTLADCNFVDEVGKTLTKSDNEINQKDVALRNLTDCTVKLYGSASAIHMNKLQNCQVFAGPVGGSVFITDCNNCVFLLPCHQLRIHSTFGSQFYVHVTSRAIIEDSKNVQFAEYNWCYEGQDDHFVLSRLVRSRNSWDDIDDFNWLAADVHSPNWSLIPENERIASWDP